MSIRLPIELFVGFSTLGHPNFPDLQNFLVNIPVMSNLEQFISSTDRFILIDGLNVANNYCFFKSIFQERIRYGLFRNIYDNCYTQMPRIFGDYLEGNVEILSREQKINLVTCVFMQMVPYLPPNLKMILFFASESTPSNVAIVTPELAVVQIQGTRYGAVMEADDLALLYTLLYLRAKGNQVAVLSNDNYNFMTRLDGWQIYRPSINTVLSHQGYVPERWDFVRGGKTNLLEFTTF